MRGGLLNMLRGLGVQNWLLQYTWYPLGHVSTCCICILCAIGGWWGTSMRGEVIIVVLRHDVVV